jgi:guanylate kinase
MTGTLYIISAPSGAGKTSLTRALVSSVSGILVSISHTTRSRRPGEKDGVDYHFIDNPQFQRMIDENAFLEHAQVFDNRYGTAKHHIQEHLARDMDVLLEIDWQGARQVRSQMPECVSVFILPPSRAALLERLRARAQDSEDVIQRRMRDAVAEMSHYGEYDYMIVNDQFDRALHELQAIFVARRLRQGAQKSRLAATLQELLE